MSGSRKATFIVQGLVCLGLIVWQIWGLAVGPFPSAMQAVFDGVVIVAAAIGLAGAVFALRTPPSPPAG